MTRKPVLSKQEKVCAACKAISAYGMFGISGYIGYHSLKFTKTPGVVIMLSIASGFAYLGTARLYDLAPFTNETAK